MSITPVRPARTLRRSSIWLLVAALGLTGFTPAATADPTPTDATLLRLGLLEFGVAFGGASALEPLATPLPMSNVAIRDVLTLDRLLSERIADALEGHPTTLETIAAVISAGDGLTMTAVEPTPTDAPAGSREWVLAVDITKDLPLPLTYADDQLVFGAAAVDGELAARLDGDFRIRFDPSADPLLRFQLIDEQLLDITAWTRASGSAGTAATARPVPAFTAVDGFVDVAVAGTVEVDTTLELRLRDPNGRGVINREDLEFGIAEDLYTMDPPGDDAVEIRLDLTSGLLDGTTHGSVIAAGQPTPDEGPWPSVEVDRDPALARLSSVTAGQAMGAFASYAGALLGLESAVDADLPLLDGRLTDLHAPAATLVAVITDQATARIQCGAADTLPPSGTPRPGQPRFCQAITQSVEADGGAATWSALDGATTITPSGPGSTVGPSPTANVRVVTTSGDPHLVVSFTEDGAPRRARSVIGSVQTLGAVLGSVGLGGAVTYDATTAALEVAVAAPTSTGQVDMPTGDAPALAPLTGLSNLCGAVAPASPTDVRTCPLPNPVPGGPDIGAEQQQLVRVTATDRTFTATLGLGLLPEGAALDVVPDVYLRPAGNVVWSIGEIDAATTDPTPLVGRIGFLQVDVDLESLTVATDTTLPAAEVLVATSDISLFGDATRPVTGVVRVGDLLAGAGMVVDPALLVADPELPEEDVVALPVPLVTRGVTVDAVLGVGDAPTDGGTRLLSVDGRIDASWSNIDPLVPPDVTTDEPYEDLRLFDVVPTLRATVTEVDDTGAATVLTADGLDLVRDLGVPVADFGDPDAGVVDRRVRRAGDDNGCGRLTVMSATSLRCDDPIDAAQVWEVGDILSIDGDPDALRDRLFDDLATLVNVFETAGPDTGGDATFPLLDLRPDQISAARRAVGVGVSSLYQAVAQAPGSPGAVDASTLQRFPAALGTAIGASTPPTLDFSTPGGVPRLELDLDHEAAEPVVVAPLRISRNDSLLRVTTKITGELDDVDVSVETDSSTRLRVALDLASGRTSVHRSTAVGEQVTGLSDAAAKIAGQDAEYAAAAWTVGAAEDISLDIGVQQTTGLPPSADEWTPLEDVRSTVVATRSHLDPASTCGIVSAPANAAACAVVPLLGAGDSTTEVVVALRADESSGGGGGALPGDQPLAVRFLSDGLVFLGTTLEQGLDGNLHDLQLPLVGADLDAGSDVPDQIVAFAQLVRAGLPATVDDTAPLASLQSAVTAAVKQAALDAGLEPVTTSALLLCAGPCPADPTVANVRTVEFPLTLRSTEASTVAVPFQSGLPGAELHSTHLLPATTTSWELTATMGISRGTGPYVRFEKDGTNDVPVLQVGSSAHLPDSDDLDDLSDTQQDCHAWTRTPPDLVVPDDDDAARCIDAVVGFLPSVLVDLGETGGTPATGYDASVTVAVEAATAGEDHYLPTLVDGLPVLTSVVGTGALNVYFEGWAGELGFVDVLGRVTMAWSDGSFDGDLEFSDLHLDSATVNEALGPVFESIRALIGVYQPIFDVLGAPVPVVSDLSKQLGGPDITMISLIVAASIAKDAQGRKKKVDNAPGGKAAKTLGENRESVARDETKGAIKLYALAIGLGSLIEQLGDAPDQGLIPLGGDEASPSGGLLSVAAQYVEKTRCGAGELDPLDQAIGAIGPDVSTGRCVEPNSTRRNFKPATGSTVRGGVSKRSTQSFFSLPGLDIPILTDPRVSYDLILGRRTTRLVQVDIGTFGAEIGLEKSFGPFMIGPVPVFASIGGSFGLQGSFSLGFDTDALTTLIRTNERGDIAAFERVALGTNDMLAKGFYIGDLDSAGRDVPEISLLVSFYVGASVSIGIATAGIRGGVEINFLFDANDPDGDGRIRVREIEANGIECAFRSSADLRFFLDFFLALEFLFATVNKSWRLYESPPFKLYDEACGDQEPVLAFPSTRDGRPTLVLTSGNQSGARNAYRDAQDERYTVRQLSLPTTPTDTEGSQVMVEVSAFQLTKTFTVPANTLIVADGGPGNDEFRFFPGSLVATSPEGAVSVTTVPFTLDTDVDGGVGIDVVHGGDGIDTADGGDQVDLLSGGLGDDVLRGGNGEDIIEAGPGDDRAYGDGDADAMTMGAGADIAFGGPGNDRISGGPGVDPTSLFATIDPALIAAQLDSGDLLVGDAGEDVIDGAFGSDIVVGGPYTRDLPSLVDATRSGIAGVAPDGQLITGIEVTLRTVQLPTEAQIRAECAIEEPAQTGVLLADEVSGGDERDYLVGGPGPDVLQGGAGPDLLCGRAGNDLLVGEGGEVTPEESGDDEILGGSGHDRMFGGPGGDTMDGGSGDDLLRGADGDDVLAGGSGADLVIGDDGADTLRGDAGTGALATEQGDGREIRCALWTTIVDGLVDLDGDLVGGPDDNGQLDGLRVVAGRVLGADGVTGFAGILGEAIFVDGKADLDGNGTGGVGDNKVLDLPRMTGAVGDGDCLLAGDDADRTIDGGPGGDRINAGPGDDPSVFGGSGNDLVRGGSGNDRVHGGRGVDLVVGDSGDDHLEGNEGDDRIRGGAGDDVLIGGSADGAVADGADVLLGERGRDVLAGGNATFVRAASGPAVPPSVPIPTGTLTLLATPLGAQLDGFDDQLFGGFDDDWAYGQEGDDLVRGGQDQDVVEGGPGADIVQGDDGDDLVLGGSSTAIGSAVGTRSGAGTPDGADRLYGDAGVDDLDGHDVLVGDNADLRVVSGSTRDRWPSHRPDVEITLFDLVTDAPAAGPFGGDTMDGGGGNDLLIGQSGDDTLQGNGGDDALEGNAGRDRLYGDASPSPRGTPGDDGLIGGSWTAGAYDANGEGGPWTATGTFDANGEGGGDLLEGDGGADTLLGDNGTILATVTLLDVPDATTDLTAITTAGDDHLLGGDGPDVLFGQSGTDLLEGDEGDDALEGNAGSDTLLGGLDDDTLVGGGSADDGRIVEGRTGEGLPDAGDRLEGGEGDDVLAGDNARLIRRLGTRTDGTRHRDVALFDVARVGAAAIDGTSGVDVLYGNSGRDLLFGQGDGDVLRGGDGDDVLEGNAGDDTLAGDGGADDLIGGGSAADGVIISSGSAVNALRLGITDRLLTTDALDSFDDSAAGLLDGRDILYGGSIPDDLDGDPTRTQLDTDDVLLGDNGRVTRQGTGSGTTTLEAPARASWATRAVRQVAMADDTPGATSGSDVLYGQLGDDDLYGQLDGTVGGPAARVTLGDVTLGDVTLGDVTIGDVAVLGDLLDGGPGEDALVGDLGIVTPTLASDLGTQAQLRTRGDFVDEQVRTTGSLVRVVELLAIAVGGDDVLLGDLGRDHLHSGAGDDAANGGPGDDAVFGADGDDDLWGGPGHDRVYGGYGRDDLDIKRRSVEPPLWAKVMPPIDRDRDPLTTNGEDLLYGGFDADALQADVGQTGPSAGDRLLDWVGAYNVYYVCESAYGAGRIQRRPDPQTLAILIELAAADGAVTPDVSRSSGWTELGLVTTRDNKRNNSPRHPEHPGGENCEGTP